MPELQSPSRDELALRRTLLANERTLLAYGRSAMMLAASGGTLWKFDTMHGNEGGLLAGALVLAAFVVVAVGWHRFLRVRRTLR